MLSGWTHQTRLRLVNDTGGALTDQQVRIGLDWRNFTPGFAAALSNGHDLRVTLADGTTTVSLYREAWDKSRKRAIVWAKFPSIPTGTSYFTVQTGNSGASDVSSFSDTFIKLTDDDDTTFLLNLDEGTGTPLDATGTYTVTVNGAPSWVASDGGAWGEFRTTPVQFSSGAHLSFDGVDDSLTMTGLLNTWPTQGTIECWVKCNTLTPTNGSRIWTKFLDITGGSNDVVSLFLTSTSRIQFFAFKDGVSIINHTTFADIDTNWFHVAATWGSDGWALYINGERQGYTSSTTMPVAGGSPQPFAIGCYFSGTTRNNHGNISVDEFRVSSRVRTREEILASVYRRKPIPGLTVEYDRWTRSASNPLLGTTPAQEPDVVVRSDGTLLMLFTDGFVNAGVTKATGPHPEGPWTVGSRVIGGGNGGWAGEAWRISIYKESDALWYGFFADAVSTGANLRYATSTDEGDTWADQGQILAASQTLESGITANGVANTALWKTPSGTWEGLVEFLQTSPAAVGNWRMVRVTGANLASLAVDTTTGVLDDLQSGVGMFGGPFAVRTTSPYLLYYHRSQTGGQPTMIQWAESEDLKTLHKGGFFPVLDFKDTFSGQQIDQVADPCILEHGGRVYLYYSLVNNGASYIRICCAVYDGSLADLQRSSLSYLAASPASRMLGMGLGLGLG